MPNVVVSIEGREELKAKFGRLKRNAQGPALERAVMAGAEVIRDEARRKAPGPHVEAEISHAERTSAQADIGPDKAHWYYQFFETGAGSHEISGNRKLAIKFVGREGNEEIRFGVSHPGMAAEPFLRPAIDGKKEEATREVGESLKRGIDQVTSG